MIVADALPPAIDRAMPASWQLPEQRALADLDMSGVDAGQHLLRVDDPVGWRGIVAASRLVQANSAPVSACQARAASMAAPVNCSIIVGPVA